MNKGVKNDYSRFGLRSYDVMLAEELGAKWYNITPKGRCQCLINDKGETLVKVERKESSYPGYGTSYLPMYVHKMEPASQALETMSGRGYTWRASYDKNGYSVILVDHEHGTEFSANNQLTMPKAITIAILKATGRIEI